MKLKSSSFALSEVTAKACSAISNASIDLSTVPKEYHNFLDIFNKEWASTLNPHRPYDFKIKLEDRPSPLIGSVYSISQTDLQLLCEFLNKHLAMGFIWPLLSPHGTLVLLAWKKDSSLHLCTNFQTLNKITKKDSYPLPCISDLLNSPQKASVYVIIWEVSAYIQSPRWPAWR